MTEHILRDMAYLEATTAIFQDLVGGECGGGLVLTEANIYSILRT